MPYVKMQTNAAMAETETPGLAARLSAEVARMLGKPESFVMAVVEAGAAMCHGGSPEPCTFVELKSIGLEEARCAEYSRALCAFLEAEIGVDSKRVYVEFKDLSRSLFGWDGATF